MGVCSSKSPPPSTPVRHPSASAAAEQNDTPLTRSTIKPRIQGWTNGQLDSGKGKANHDKDIHAFSPHPNHLDKHKQPSIQDELIADVTTNPFASSTVRTAASSALPHPPSAASSNTPTPHKLMVMSSSAPAIDGTVEDEHVSTPPLLIQSKPLPFQPTDHNAHESHLLAPANPWQISQEFKVNPMDSAVPIHTSSSACYDDSMDMDERKYNESMELKPVVHAPFPPRACFGPPSLTSPTGRAAAAKLPPLGATTGSYHSTLSMHPSPFLAGPHPIPMSSPPASSSAYAVPPLASALPAVSSTHSGQPLTARTAARLNGLSDEDLELLAEVDRLGKIFVPHKCTYYLMVDANDAHRAVVGRVC